jgi:threonine dehydratase
MAEAAALIDQAPDLATIRAARERIRGVVRRTPVLGSPAIDAICGARILFKCESLQEIGAFKARGASNAILSLGEAEAAKGVVTHSSGNHGAAVAWAAARRGIPAWVVMPSQATAVKQEAVKSYGGKVKHCGPTVDAREKACAAVQVKTGATLIHPYNDWRVIAGQGTAALELLEEAPDLDVVITPVGGGGLLSGTAIAAKGIEPSIKVYGAEPAGADDAFQSLRAGRIVPQTDPHTIADGLRSSLGDKTFAVIRARVDGIGTVSEEAIVAAMRLLWEKLRLVIEPSGAVPLACLLAKKLPVERRRIGIILSGGNVDLDRLPWQS